MGADAPASTEGDPLKRLLAVSAVTTVALGVAVAPASAATKHGVTPLTPKAGTVLPVGSPITFSARVVGKGGVFFRVCTNRNKDREGLICKDELMLDAKSKKGRVFSVTPMAFTFPDYFMMKPATYYWQAYRIARVGNDLSQEGPIVPFSVVAPAG
jgi:hypothetical protein